MKASEFVAAVILKATGKSSTSISGDTKWLKILGIGNLIIDTWQNESEVDWNSLYDPLYNIGTISATDTYELDSSIRKISDTPEDYVIIFHSDGVNYTKYKVVTADTLKNYYDGQQKETSSGHFCAQMGRSLVFNRIFTATDPQFGGTIRVPIYKFARHLVRDNDLVPVDIPSFLVIMSASEYVRTDVTRQGQAPGLIAEATPLMERMIADNEAQYSQVHRPWSAAGQTWA